jgi:hypothetical protein
VIKRLYHLLVVDPEMAKSKQLLIEMLHRDLFPALERSGFVLQPFGTYDGFYFTRRCANRADLIAVVFDQHNPKRPRFSFGAGQSPLDGVVYRGEWIPSDRLLLPHVRVNATLQPRPGIFGGHWFDLKTSRTKVPEKQCEELTQSVVALLPQIEAWLEVKERGPNISVVDRSPRRALLLSVASVVTVSCIPWLFFLLAFAFIPSNRVPAVFAVTVIMSFLAFFGMIRQLRAIVSRLRTIPKRKESIT